MYLPECFLWVYIFVSVFFFFTKMRSYSMFNNLFFLLYHLSWISFPIKYRVLFSNSFIASHWTQGSFMWTSKDYLHYLLGWFPRSLVLKTMLLVVLTATLCYSPEARWQKSLAYQARSHKKRNQSRGKKPNNLNSHLLSTWIIGKEG